MSVRLKKYSGTHIFATIFPLSLPFFFSLLSALFSLLSLMRKHSSSPAELGGRWSHAMAV